MKEPRRIFETVVVGVDGRGGGRAAIAFARTLAEPGARFVLAEIVCPRGGAKLRTLVADGDCIAAENTLERERQAAGLHANIEVEIASSPGRGLRSVAERERCDLLVVGSSHRGTLGRVLLGDDSRDALESAPCAVAIASHGDQGTEIRSIGVGDDGSPESGRALALARGIADRHGARLRVCAIVGPQSLSYRQLAQMDATSVLDRREYAEMRRLSRLGDADVEVVRGEIGDALAELSETVDLLVIGSRGQGRWRRVVNGSTGEYLARRGSCPLLVVPHGSR